MEMRVTPLHVAGSRPAQYKGIKPAPRLGQLIELEHTPLTYLSLAAVEKAGMTFVPLLPETSPTLPEKLLVLADHHIEITVFLVECLGAFEVRYAHAEDPGAAKGAVFHLAPSQVAKSRMFPSGSLA